MNAKTYRIGEAATLLNLKTYVLRFWEMEFPQIAPIRTEKGQRLYSEQDLAVLRRIRYLLHERGLTIEGARRVLREEEARGGVAPDAEPDIASAAAFEGTFDGDGDGEGESAEGDEAALAQAFAAGGAAPGASSVPSAPLPPGASVDAALSALGATALSPELMREVAAELTAVRNMLKP